MVGEYRHGIILEEHRARQRSFINKVVLQPPTEKQPQSARVGNVKRMWSRVARQDLMIVMTLILRTATIFGEVIQLRNAKQWKRRFRPIIPLREKKFLKVEKSHGEQDLR